MMFTPGNAPLFQPSFMGMPMPMAEGGSADDILGETHQLFTGMNHFAYAQEQQELAFQQLELQRQQQQQMLQAMHQQQQLLQQQQAQYLAALQGNMPPNLQPNTGALNLLPNMGLPQSPFGPVDSTLTPLPADLLKIPDIPPELLNPSQGGAQTPASAPAPESEGAHEGHHHGPAPEKAGPLSVHTEGVLTSDYGPRGGRQHKGVDIAADVGTTIGAAAAGKVVHVGDDPNGYGKFLIIDHGKNEKGQKKETLYAHADKIHVKVGDIVTKGQKIADMGNTGRSTGPHLHFEVLLDEKAVNPHDHIDFSAVKRA